MKKLGLIGGVGPESTIPYYHDIVYGVQKRVGRAYFPELTIESLSTFEVIRMSSQGMREELTAYLLKGIRHLEAAGAEVGALTCNTGHMVFEELQAQAKIPLVSIVDVTCAEAQRQGFTRLGLLGTAATMNGTFFNPPFERVGIKVITPLPEEKEMIARKIPEELELGIVNAETVSAFTKVVERMTEKEKIQAVILGCTELPMLFRGVTLPVPVLDTMQIHIKELINKIMESGEGQP